MSRYIGFYNGGSGAEYDQGVTVSSSPTSFGAGIKVNGRDEQQSPTILDDNTIKGAPSPVLVNDEIYVYYDGYDDSSVKTGKIMLEVYNRDGVPRYRSITPVILPSEVTGMASIARPSVLYEPWDTNAPFKMVFSATATAGGLNDTVWVAKSWNGFQWIILGQVLTTGTGWESTALITTGRLVNHNGC